MRTSTTTPGARHATSAAGDGSLDSAGSAAAAAAVQGLAPALDLVLDWAEVSGAREAVLLRVVQLLGDLQESLIGELAA
jgi:hypothetical protein